MTPTCFSYRQHAQNVGIHDIFRRQKNCHEQSTSSTVLAGVAAFILPLGIAWAAAFVHDTATHKWKSGVSGTAGTVKSHVIASSRGLHQLASYERSDDPITFSIYESPINPNSANSIFAGKVNALSWKQAANGHKSVDIGSDRVATAIQACVSNDKIKGLRLWGKTVNANGTLGANARRDEFKRANCGNNDWKTKISCGSDKIITGLRFHVHNFNKGFSGVSIRCSKIR